MSFVINFELYLLGFDVSGRLQIKILLTEVKLIQVKITTEDNSVIDKTVMTEKKVDNSQFLK